MTSSAPLLAVPYSPDCSFRLATVFSHASVSTRTTTASLLKVLSAFSTAGRVDPIYPQQVNENMEVNDARADTDIPYRRTLTISDVRLAYYWTASCSRPSVEWYLAWRCKLFEFTCKKTSVDASDHVRDTICSVHAFMCFVNPATWLEICLFDCSSYDGFLDRDGVGTDAAGD